jgi:hypothetical protein
MGEKVIESNIKVTFQYDLERVWNVVTSLTDYSWRSDLKKIEVVSDTRFIEITKGGYQTAFTVTAKEPYHKWEFDMENDKMSGHWLGLFSEKGGETIIDFTEYISPKKWFLKPFVKIYLKRQQSQYVKDLMRVLERQPSIFKSNLGEEA